MILIYSHLHLKNDEIPLTKKLNIKFNDFLVYFHIKNLLHYVYIILIIKVHLTNFVNNFLYYLHISKIYIIIHTEHY